MTGRSRDILTVVMVFLLAITAFVAGYAVNDFVELRTGRALANSEQGDFAIFWEAWGWVEQSYIGEIPTSQQLAYGAIRGALGVLNDPYTIFIEPAVREQERDSLRGNFGGIGATLERNENGDVLLTPIPGNPAEVAGILEGDILLAVDGQEITAEMTVEEIAQMIRGEKGTAVTLTVVHPGAAGPVEIEVQRADILIPSVTFRLLPEDSTIGYIQLTRFSAESSGEVQQAILGLQEQGAEKLILDLRHNGGGLLDAAVDVSDLFLSSGPILYQVSRAEEERVFSATEENVAGVMPLVVLVDEATASSAEIVAGALRDHQRAILVGATTFGKGSVQLVYDLSDGSSVHVTSARWFTPNRHQIDQQGLAPDIVVEITPEAVADGRDEILERAVAYLQNGN
ncbi:MAG: S41 family peptidase [Chloroflexi bacterium]|nr:S41 family peptidase [Chloroflexota bacterium]MCI0576069.1 S41 family peptidase [Chloroflexota bacterium]MCI0647857.1 S41 family peptidase [Chloroflexota bacterium]MCI0727108.1 S41 family peptidase [Chloroflexota bacterium]